MSSDWLDDRIRQVTQFSPHVVWSDRAERYTPKADDVVALIKVRVKAKDVQWMARDFQRWVDRGIDGVAVSRRECEAPGWYESFEPVIPRTGRSLTHAVWD